MSTTYGKIRLRDGRLLHVEAYGATHCVKLEWPTGEEIIALDSHDAVAALISALEGADIHCWEML